MVEIVWTEPALSDLDAIADYIALENPIAAHKLVRRIFRHVEQLKNHPDSGSNPVELEGRNYRQIIQPPCRVFYRHDDKRAYVLHVMRSEQRFRASKLKSEFQPESTIQGVKVRSGSAVLHRTPLRCTA